MNKIEIPYLVHKAPGFWVPHHVIPIFTHAPSAVTVHDMAHISLANIFGLTKILYAKWMF